MSWIALPAGGKTAYEYYSVSAVFQGLRRRYGRGRTNNPTDNVWPKLTKLYVVVRNYSRENIFRKLH